MNLAVILILLAVSATAEGRLECLSDTVSVVPNRLPIVMDVGVSKVRYDKPISIFVPVPPGSGQGCSSIYGAAAFDGKSRNVLSLRSQLPQRFVISDGTLARHFIGADMRQGTRLALCVDELTRIFTNNYTRDAEDTYLALRDHLQDYLKQGDHFPWDDILLPPSNPDYYLGMAKPLDVLARPLPIGWTHPVIPLEKFLEHGHARCIERGLLAGLVMQNARLRFRLMMGGGRDPGIGHTWLIVGDHERDNFERALDPTYRVLGEHPPEDPNGWFDYGAGPVFYNHHFPFVDLGP